MTTKPREPLLLSATPKPGDFTIGSAESRAAARMLAENRQDTRERHEIITHISNAEEDRVPYASPWEEYDGELFRTVYIPIHWEREPFSGKAPVCPACGTPYRKKECWPGWVWVLFEAACVERHVPS